MNTKPATTTQLHHPVWNGIGKPMTAIPVATVIPITGPQTRADLARMVPNGGLIIELGVAAGEFAAAMLTANPAARYFGIDRWSDHHGEDEYLNARVRIRALGGIVKRSTFSDALPVPFMACLVYVDGYAHTGQERGETIRDWWHVVEPGGIFAGHDYDPEHYPQTVAAVDAFVAEHGLALNIIEEKPHASWWVVKPLSE